MTRPEDPARYPIDEFGYPAPRLKAHPTLHSYLDSRTDDEIAALIWNPEYQGNIFGTYSGTVGEHSAAIVRAIEKRVREECTADARQAWLDGIPAAEIWLAVRARGAIRKGGEDA